MSESREESKRERDTVTCNSLSFKYLFLTSPIANKVMTCTLCRSCLNCRSAAVNAFDFLLNRMSNLSVR